jgi:hypothetical protein
MTDRGDVMNSVLTVKSRRNASSSVVPRYCRDGWRPPSRPPSPFGLALRGALPPAVAADHRRPDSHRVGSGEFDRGAVSATSSGESSRRRASVATTTGHPRSGRRSARSATFLRASRPRSSSGQFDVRQPEPAADDPAVPEQLLGSPGCASVPSKPSADGRIRSRTLPRRGRRCDRSAGAGGEHAASDRSRREIGWRSRGTTTGSARVLIIGPES